MKKLSAIFLLLSLLVVVTARAASTSARIDSLLSELDRVIAGRDAYLETKEQELSRLRNEVGQAADDHDRFRAVDALFNAYHSFNADSAYMLSLELDRIAHRAADPALIMNADLHRVNLLRMTGMYSEATALLDSIDRGSIPGYLLPYYYHSRRSMYGDLAEFAAFEPEQKHYLMLTDMYRDSLMSVNDPGSLGYVITLADHLNVSGHPANAIDEMTRFMEGHDLSEHDRAICSWTLSESYGLTGDIDLQKEHVIRSAISDMRSSVREYVSLRQLALMLYREGDLSRAYRFMTIALDDARKCNARQRIIQLNDTYPEINQIYIDTVKDQKNTLERAIAVITLMALVLIAMLFYMRRQMRNIARAREVIENAYATLNDLNERLTVSNAKLSEANCSISEMAELKEAYISRYMDRCVDYIEKLDSYRKSIGKLVNSGNDKDLKQLVKSTKLIDDELKSFYDEFDRTFLNLFPTFVRDFNSLLMPGEEIVPKKSGSLNAELRIFALIRLGITDSDRIAKFLRYSLTTIYNYRTKVRNKARGDRGDLENEVMRIGRIDGTSRP